MAGSQARPHKVPLLLAFVMYPNQGFAVSPHRTIPVDSASSFLLAFQPRGVAVENGGSCRAAYLELTAGSGAGFSPPPAHQTVTLFRSSDDLLRASSPPSLFPPGNRDQQLATTAPCFGRCPLPSLPPHGLAPAVFPSLLVFLPCPCLLASVTLCLFCFRQNSWQWRPRTRGGGPPPACSGLRCGRSPTPTPTPAA